MAFRNLIRILIPGGIGFKFMKTLKDNTTIRPTEVEKDLNVNINGLYGVKKEIIVGNHAINLASRNTVTLGKVKENENDE